MDQPIGLEGNKQLLDQLNLKLESVIDLMQRQNLLLEQIAGKKEEKHSQAGIGYPLKAEVTDIGMSIGSMITFMFKWILASIPVSIALVLAYILIVLIFGVSLAGLFS